MTPQNGRRYATFWAIVQRFHFFKLKKNIEVEVAHSLLIFAETEKSAKESKVNQFFKDK